MADGDERCFINPYLVDLACNLSFDGTTEKPEVSCKHGYVEMSRGICVGLCQCRYFHTLPACNPLCIGE